MKITGNIYEIINLSAFAVAYLANPNNLPANSYKPAANLRLHLASVAGPFPLSFFPQVSIKTTSAANGSFTLRTTAAQDNLFNINKKAYLLAYKKVGTVNIGFTSVDIFEPVYRCQAFEVAGVGNNKTVKLYYAPYNVPNESGIQQAMVDSQIAAAKNKFPDISKLSASINQGHLSVSGSGRGAEIKFKIELGVATSSNLSEYITGKVKDFDVDLPGPDFITGICVSEAEIERDVKKGIADMMKEANKTVEASIIDGVAASTGLPSAVVATFVKSNTTITFTSLQYPVVGQKEIKIPGTTIKLPIRAVVPKLCIGMPRSI